MTREELIKLHELLTEYIHHKNKEEHIEEIAERLQYEILLELK